MFGYHGRVLVVDLATRTSRWDPLDEDVLRSFVGGIGLGTYLLYRYCPQGVEPLDAANPLIFVGSPLIGSRLTTSSKFAVLTKSPLTGFIGDSLSSSFVATELKKNGCDALVVVGKSDSPTLLSVVNGEVDFKDADELMGLGTADTEQAVKGRLGSRFRVMCIGPAGRTSYGWRRSATTAGVTPAAAGRGQ